MAKIVDVNGPFEWYSQRTSTVAAGAVAELRAPNKIPSGMFFVNNMVKNRQSSLHGLNFRESSFINLMPRFNGLAKFLKAIS